VNSRNFLRRSQQEIRARPEDRQDLLVEVGPIDVVLALKPQYINSLLST